MATAMKLGPTDHGRPMTWDEFAAADYEEGYRYELNNGRLYVSPAPNLPQDRIQMWLFSRLFLYSLQHPDVLNYLSPSSRVIVPSAGQGSRFPNPTWRLTGTFPWTCHLPRWFGRTSARSWSWKWSPTTILTRTSCATSISTLRVESIREYWIVDPRANADQPTMLIYRRRGPRWQRVIEVGFGETYTTKLLPGFTLILDPRR